MISRSPTYSTARIDTLVCPVLVDRNELQACLPPCARLSLPHLSRVPDGKHPIIVEVWRVRDGLIQFGAVTAHQWWELAGGAAGLGFGGSAGAALGAGVGGASGAVSGGAFGMWFGPLGWWWGTAAGAAAGAAIGGAVTASLGAMQGARVAASAGRLTSETASRVIGTYNEIIVTVPCRRVMGAGHSADFAFVLATYTDSAASILGERLFGWGYRKSPAFGTRTGDGVLEVSTGPSDARFRIVSRVQPNHSPGHDLISAAAHVITTLSDPLLGLLAGNRTMVSHLERSFTGDRVHITPTAIRLETGDSFLPGLRGVAEDIGPSGEDNPWGAFSVTGMPVALSYPCDADEQEFPGASLRTPGRVT